MSTTFLNHTIGAYKLAGHFDGLYYAFIDDMLDFDIKPARYPKIIISRIKAAYANRFILENK